MRKRALALTSVGIGAGVLYAIGKGRANSHQRRESDPKKLKSDNPSDNRSEQGSNLSDLEADTNSSNKAASMKLVGDVARSDSNQKEDFDLDDRGTGQQEALHLLGKIKAEIFESSDEQFALALGRPVDEIQAWATGEQTIDSDVLIKARALALERGVNIERD